MTPDSEARDPLELFVRDLMGFYREDPDREVVRVTEAALKHGLLETKVLDEPCGERCFCKEYGMTFPTKCNQPTDLLRRIME